MTAWNYGYGTAGYPKGKEMNAAEVRVIVREELERARLIEKGHVWVDGCTQCGAPTHGSRKDCPFLSLGPPCDPKGHDVHEERGTKRDGAKFHFYRCRECNRWSEKTTRV